MRFLVRICFFLAVAVGSFSTATAGEDVLFVLVDAENQILFSQPAKTGDAFTIRFTHSYAKSTVEEFFQISGIDQFTLRESRYHDFGAGLPHEPLAGQTMAFGDGSILISGYDTVFTDLRLRVGHIADHEIDIAGITVKLADLVRPGGEIGVRVMPVP